MVDVKKFSDSAGGNNRASPDGFPEGMAPSGVNDSAREVMAAIKRWYDDAEWRSFDDTPTLNTSASFTVATDLTGRYHNGRRVRVRLQNSDIIYGTITSASFSSNTRVTINTDEGSLSGSLSAVALGWEAINQSQPAKLAYPLDSGGFAITNSPFEVLTATGSREITAGDAGKLLVSANQFSLVTSASASLAVGTVISLLATSSGANFTAAGSVTLRAPNGKKAQSAYALLSVLKFGSDEWVVVGDATEE